MIDKKTRISLFEFLCMLGNIPLLALLQKHDVIDDREADSLQSELQMSGLLGPKRALQNILSAEHQRILSLITDLVGTARSYRTQIDPKYRFDLRWEDLERCLELDGYRVQRRALIAIEPSIADAPPIDDELTAALESSGLEQRVELCRLLDNSSTDFRKNPPDYNGSLTNIRVTLEELAKALAKRLAPAESSDKWGDVLVCLRNAHLIDKRQEQGLAGVYTFISQGAHAVVGLDESEFTRVGRSLGALMCYFLIKRFSAEPVP